MNIGENLQKYRKVNNMTQEDLADKCGVSRQAIAKWENSESVPTVDKLIYLADIYNVTLDELVGRSNVDKYARIKEFLLEFKAEDIPIGEEDKISAIVTRYFEFVESLELDAKDKLRGLQEIFLNKYKF